MILLPWQEVSPAHIYIHIPYCLKKCPYCDFVSYCLADAALSMDSYTDLLLSEIRGALQDESEVPITTIYFGGGTPSILSADQLIAILTEIRKHRVLATDCEITLEMNPGTRDSQDLGRLFAAGFTRLSIGLQTTSNERLRRLGRIHSVEDYLATLAEARRVGFQNISTDLMSALPYETMEDVEEDLDFLLTLDLPHVSIYSLIVEEATPFGQLYREGEAPLPDDKTERAMYHLIREHLSSAGLEPYEISNLAKPGFESRHNLAYWRGESYYGFGAGASSYVFGQRRTNPASLEDYAAQISQGLEAAVEEVIDQAEAEKEFYIFRLRMAEGFSEEDFQARFGHNIPDRVKEILTKFVTDGLLTSDGKRWMYTKKGLDYADLVARELI